MHYKFDLRRPLFLVSALAFLALLFLQTFEMVTGEVLLKSLLTDRFIKGLLVTTFLVCLHVDLRYYIEQIPSIKQFNRSFYPIIKLLLVGLLGVSASYLIGFISHSYNQDVIHLYTYRLYFGFIAFSASLSLHLLSFYLPGTTGRNKYIRLILDTALIMSLIFCFLPIRYLEASWLIALVAFFPLLIWFSVMQSWIFSLESSKRQGVSRMLLILLFTNLVCAVTIPLYTEHAHFYPLPFQSLPIIVLIAINILYSLISLILIYFGFPGMTSKYPDEEEQISLFERLSVAILEGSSPDQVYKALFENTVEMLRADVAWMTTPDFTLLDKYAITAGSLESIGDHLIQLLKEPEEGVKTSTAYPVNFRILNGGFRSMLHMPVYAGSELIANIFLLQRPKRAYNEVAIARTNTLAKQAGVAVQNLQLIKETRNNQRVKSELQIARNVQQRLLPAYPDSVNELSFFATSKSAHEVGGDYYDIHRFKDGSFAVIIADVSGNGIPAAINMAQLKGIFQTLVHLRLPPSKFMTYCNKALEGCLDKNVFISASYFHINTKIQKIIWSRAGHCPGLYYDAQSREANYLEANGLGLGIIRDDSYADFVHTNDKDYQPGDVLFLYTDGLVEVKGINDEEYGYDRLKDAFFSYIQQPPAVIAERILEEISLFGQAEKLEDDHTLVFVKF